MGFFDKLFGGKKPARPAGLNITSETGTLYAPTSGKVEITADIPDPVFACEAMGKTIAIWPEDGTVFAPLTGSITAAMPHAFGIMGDDGMEILIHVGVDTVNMKGDGFTVYVKSGEHVEAGDALLTFDRAKVAKAGYQDIVMTIVTNSDDYPELTKVTEGSAVVVGTKIMWTA